MIESLDMCHITIVKLTWMIRILHDFYIIFTFYYMMITWTLHTAQTITKDFTLNLHLYYMFFTKSLRDYKAGRWWWPITHFYYIRFTRFLHQNYILYYNRFTSCHVITMKYKWITWKSRYPRFPEMGGTDFFM